MSKLFPFRRPRSARRSGFLLAAVLIALTIVSALVITWMHRAIERGRQDREAQWNLQAEWLTESSLARSVARLSAKADYVGETWNIPSSELSGADSATVVVSITLVDGHASQRLIKVDADYPAAALLHARRSKQLVVDIGDAKVADAGQAD